jgi:hypothetical protein
MNTTRGDPQVRPELVCLCAGFTLSHQSGADRGVPDQSVIAGASAACSGSITPPQAVPDMLRLGTASLVADTRYLYVGWRQQCTTNGLAP